MKKRLMLLLPTGMTVRNILSTNVLKYLLKNQKIEIICCIKEPSKYKSNFNMEGIKYIDFYKKKYSFSSFLLSILRYRFEYIKSNQSIEILKKGPIQKNYLYNFFSVLRYPFPGSMKIYQFFFKMLKFTYIPHKEIINQLDNYKPDLIFATHIVTKDEFDYIATAKIKKIPVLGMIKSFDNLTSKGFIPIAPDFAFLWNDIMKEELVKIYNYEKKKAFVTGIPHFDIYQKKPIISREKFSKKFNFCPKKYIILFATNHLSLSPDDNDNIVYISKYLDKLNANLLVRIHPNDDPDRYKLMKLKNVYFHCPGISEGKDAGKRVSYNNFLNDLRDNLFFADVTINTASTMTLDASAMNKPIINIGYDFRKKPYHRSVKRYYDLLHYKPIMKLKATSLATSKSELIKLISDYLENPMIKNEERKKLNHLMLSKYNGKACLNIADIINKILFKEI